MDGVQAKRTLAAAESYDPALAERWRRLYKWPVGGQPSYGPPPDYNARLGLLIRDLCSRHGILDRMPRYIEPGDLAVNKRIAERLFLKTYDLELERAQNYRIWAYRKAAWGVDEWHDSIAQLFRRRGQAGLREIPGVGRGMAGTIAAWLEKETLNHDQG